jgi:hypothetical protein
MRHCRQHPLISCRWRTGRGHFPTPLNGL